MAIAVAKNYTDLLDEVYAEVAVSAVLNSDDTLAQKGANAGEIMIPKLTMDGLGDYSRNSGYTKGDVSFSWQTVPFNYDRGRKFEVDSMDNEETIGLAFGNLASQFVRTKVAPEEDAFTFATLAGTTGISKVSAGATFASGVEAMAALDVAVAKLDEDEVSEEDRYLFITPTVLRMIRSLDTTKSKEVLDGFKEIKKTPQKRFYTAITLYDGSTSGEEAGGYIKATGAKDINFMIVQKSAILKFNKHLASDIITPEENQSSDGYMQKYRKYGLVDVYENKVAGIYLHHKA